MSSKFTKVAAIAATTALTIAGAQGVASAQSLNLQSSTEVQVDADGNPIEAPAGQGSLDLGSLTGGNATNGGGSLAAYGQSPEAGSLLRPVNSPDAPGAAEGFVGSLDTSGSLGEPTTGSLAPFWSQIAGGSFNVSNPAPGTGSVDTTGSALGEPTTGSLAPIWSQVAGALGMDQGITTVIGSEGGAGGSLNADSVGGGAVGALLPIVLVGGSVAAAVAAAPMIQDALAGAGIVLPGMPAVPAPPAIPGPPAPPAPGPVDTTGRG